nr:unnamed protein product [Spodoptera littoralis]
MSLRVLKIKLTSLLFLVQSFGEGHDGFREDGDSDDDGLNGYRGGFDDLDGLGGDLDNLDGFRGDFDDVDGFRGDIHNVDGFRHDGFGGDSGANGDGASLSGGLVDVQDDLDQGSAGSSYGSDLSDGSGSDNNGARDNGLLSDNTTVGKREVDDGGPTEMGWESASMMAGPTSTGSGLMPRASRSICSRAAAVAGSVLGLLMAATISWSSASSAPTWVGLIIPAEATAASRAMAMKYFMLIYLKIF